MNSETLKRIVSLCVLFISLFVFPWWVSAIFVIFFILFFDHPYEMFVFGIMLDGLYGVPFETFFKSHIFFVGTVFALFLSIWIKEHFMFRIS